MRRIYLTHAHKLTQNTKEEKKEGEKNHGDMAWDERKFNHQFHPFSHLHCDFDQ